MTSKRSYLGLFQRIRAYVLKNRFEVCIWLVILLAFILRFDSFFNRIGFGSDQARDILIASEALKHFKIPLIGPFASGGPFVYGPEWFWMIMGMILFNPNFLFTPWIIHAFLSVAVVYVMIKIGLELSGKIFAIILGTLIAISPVQVTQATSLTSPSMVGFLAIIVVYFFILFLKYARTRDGFLLGLFIGLSITVHFQAIGLAIFLFISWILSKRNIKQGLFMILGAAIPFIPLLVFDLRNNFFETRNLLYYYFHDQYNVSFEVLGRNWKTFLGVFIPESFTKILGGNIYITYLIFLISPFVGLYAFIKKKITKQMFGVFVYLAIAIFMLRYYRGPISDTYLSFLHGFIFVGVGFVIYNLYKVSKYLGLGLFLVIIAGSIYVNYISISRATNVNIMMADSLTNTLRTKFPGEKFEIYDLSYSTSRTSVPLALYLNHYGLTEDGGHKIGVKAEDENRIRYVGKYLNFQLIDLNKYTQDSLREKDWVPVNPSKIYSDVQEWYLK